MPNRGEALDTLGWVYAQKGMLGEAEETLKQAVALTQSLHWPPVIPLQLPFLLLGLLTSLVQAFVFALLTTIYLALMLPHEEHEESAVAHA